MATTGHENESINVSGLKASLQKFKDEYIGVGGDYAYIGNDDGSAPSPEFSPVTDTVWNKPQVLTTTQKDSALSNLYDKTFGNGMGKVILKATDNFKTVVESYTSGNMIFIIQYDYTLTGNVTIPANCILQFEGGSISGAYTITGNNTGIRADLIKIFNTNVTLNGSFNNEKGYIEWFGAKGDGITNNTSAIQKAFDSFQIVYVGEGQYNTDSLNLNKVRSVIGLDRTHGILSNLHFVFNGTSKTGIYLNQAVSDGYISLKNIKFTTELTENKNSDYGWDYEPDTICFDHTKYSTGCRIERCSFHRWDKCILDTALSSGSVYNRFIGCWFYWNNICFNNIVAYNFTIQNVQCANFGYFIKGIGGGGGPIRIENCTIENSDEVNVGIVLYNSSNINAVVILENNYFEGNSRITDLRLNNSSFIATGNLIDMGRYSEKAFYIQNARTIFLSGNMLSVAATNQVFEYYLETQGNIDNSGKILSSVVVKDSAYDNGFIANNNTYKGILINHYGGLAEYCSEIIEPFSKKIVYTFLRKKSLTATPNKGYIVDSQWLNQDRSAAWQINNNRINLSGELKRSGTAITEGTTNIASIDNFPVAIVNPYQDHQSAQQYTDKYVYIKAMDSSYEPVILKFHFLTAQFDFIKGDVTKDIILDGCEIPMLT